MPGLFLWVGDGNCYPTPQQNRRHQQKCVPFRSVHIGDLGGIRVAAFLRKNTELSNAHTTL